MRLKNYIPTRNEIVLELKNHQKVRGLYAPTPQTDKIMKVLAVGPMVEKVKVGDLVLMDAAPMPQLEFENPEDPRKPIIALQGREYNILGFYNPDEDETTYFVPGETGKISESAQGLNIIDNPGIDKAPFLKEQGDFLTGLNN